MKAYADIEDLRLSGEKVDGGYIVNGSLPWVSNLGEDHMFGTLFAIDGDKDKPVMALVDCSSKGFELRLSAHFVALEGTRTFACIFNDVFIPDEMIIDHDGKSFMKKARFGMIMLQAGMAAGNIQACIDICKDNEARLGHVNAYLDDRPEELQEELDDLLDACIALAEDPYDTSDDHFKDVLQLRLTAGELTLRASQSAMLHAGASGYLIKAKAQRKLRESYFVAIVTPAIKHLRKQLAEMA
jgi:alkylation response protein AidB-like acyl-CoA dehydrogenase